MKRHLFTYTLIVCMYAMFASCNRSDDYLNPNDSVSSNNLEIPYSDPILLRSYETDKQIVAYDFMRNIAHIDMSINKTYAKRGWHNARLSDLPVAIFGFDNKPLFYDFIVLGANNKKLGTITVNARKTSAMPIYSFSNGITDYNGTKTKAGGSDFFADRYGYRYVGVIDRSSTSTKVATRASDGIKVSNRTHEEDYELLHNIRTKYLPSFFGSDHKLIDSIANRMKREMIKEHNAAKLFWDEMENCRDQIMQGTATPTPLISKDEWHDDGEGNYNGWGVPGPKTDPINKFNVLVDGEVAWIREYQEWSKKYEHPGNYCGPWIAGFVLSTCNK